MWNTPIRKCVARCGFRVLIAVSRFSGALVHLLKSSLGTGILAIPSAVAAAGIIVGVVGTVLTGILCTHTIHLLVNRLHCGKTTCGGTRINSIIRDKHCLNNLIMWSVRCQNYFLEDIARLSSQQPDSD